MRMLVIETIKQLSARKFARILQFYILLSINKLLSIASIFSFILTYLILQNRGFRVAKA
ncbi:hypothetical protein HMPREF9151_02462 [Hoylesella saccharolytica F0055]|uniref:Uncharacterized protein n=1 Tax=Hoylesella saccharolytica F0055 TaxID=1127699 RepID=L1MYN2_9BACT|nr:hypothetical protein HMPREF9151_02462 [Hoylesella saccharolytica F0055]